eukprot:6093838-Pyramimonas_sp.AAC.1
MSTGWTRLRGSQGTLRRHGLLYYNQPCTWALGRGTATSYCQTTARGTKRRPNDRANSKCRNACAKLIGSEGRKV